MTTDRELAFHGAMVDLYLRAKREANYNATYFLEMISDAELGGHRTPRQLIHTTTPSLGYEALYDRGRLDLTVEAVILRPEWADLFADEEHERAPQAYRLRLRCRPVRRECRSGRW